MSYNLKGGKVSYGFGDRKVWMRIWDNKKEKMGSIVGERNIESYNLYLEDEIFKIKYVGE